MAGQDYVPLYVAGTQASCVAGSAVTAGQLVQITGGTLVPGTPGVAGGQPNSGTVTPTVAPTSDATSAEVGVAANNAVAGQPVSVYFGGVHVLAASGSISAGDPVQAAASGAVADASSNTTYSQIIGRAWSAASNGFAVVRLAEH
ncbi:hypothetical protein MXEN_12061 [Mycobacterium xenopi RIVM700367]|jgi:hypothetical protein|uniref:DUF2190 domain-containing protein n=1 Tax=Mycobacterium botniense TaxID=84962 RepID=A0A7I9XRT8_9MYCO|nr:MULTISPECIES: capsid cement protein [Mycobacterium]EID12941.1 hypothetical protein MXEN_12061 [Mycobacterium xenopi RIVM700367]GFG72699.1 hypothetical protein MBOT_00640 [Mycobacterium botniense]